jgi:hypothetical protein
MAFRFRKSLSLGKGVRLNFTKRGVSVSAGRRGARITTGTSGTRVSASIPGTGVGYTKKLASRGSHENTANVSSMNFGGLLALIGVLGCIASLSAPEWFAYSIPAVLLGLLWSRRIKKKRQVQLAALEVADELAVLLEKLNKGKSLTARLKNCQAALHLLETVRQLDRRQKVVTNQKQLRRLLEAILRVLPVVDAFEKAELKKLEGNYKSALKNSDKALSLCQENNVSDRDLAKCEARDQKKRKLTIRRMSDFRKQLVAKVT